MPLAEWGLFYRHEPGSSALRRGNHPKSLEQLFQADIAQADLGGEIAHGRGPRERDEVIGQDHDVVSVVPGIHNGLPICL